MSATSAQRRAGDARHDRGLRRRLEMSGSPDALRGMLESMSTAGASRLLGFLEGESAIDWERVIFSGLTPRGHLRPPDVRDVVQDDRHAAERPRRLAGLSPTVPLHEFKAAFDVMLSGRSGKVILDWATE